MTEAYYGAPDQPRRVTQRRRIERAAILVGLYPAQDRRLAESLACELSLMGLDHGEARSRFGQARGLVERGRAVVDVLAGLAMDVALWPKLAASGCRSGLWGRPALWVPRIGRLVFPSGGTSTLANGRAPP